MRKRITINKNDIKWLKLLQILLICLSIRGNAQMNALKYGIMVMFGRTRCNCVTRKYHALLQINQISRLSQIDLCLDVTPGVDRRQVPRRRGSICWITIFNELLTTFGGQILMNVWCFMPWRPMKLKTHPAYM